MTTISDRNLRICSDLFSIATSKAKGIATTCSTFSISTADMLDVKRSTSPPTLVQCHDMPSTLGMLSVYRTSIFIWLGTVGFSAWTDGLASLQSTTHHPKLKGTAPCQTAVSEHKVPGTPNLITLRNLPWIGPPPSDTSPGTRRM